MVALLAEVGPTAGRDITTQVPALQGKLTYRTGEKAQTVGVVTRVMTVLSASGQIIRARAGGAWHDRQPRWILMRDWCPQAVRHPPLQAAAARAELTRHWLREFGPATFEDVKWWTGWSATQTKVALRDVGAVEVHLEGDSIGMVLPDDVATAGPVDPWVALLPSLDPTTMGWKDREWYLGSHRQALFDPYGNAGPTVWSDGRVVGGWGQRPDGRVVVRLLDDIGTEKAAQVDAEAARLTEWLAGVRVRPSFPTPLQHELSS